MATASRANRRVTDTLGHQETPSFVFRGMTPLQSELTLFAILTALGIAASQYSVDIESSGVSVDGRWIFLFLGIGLYRRGWLALIQSALLVALGPLRIPLLAALGVNLLCTLPSTLMVRYVLRRLPPPSERIALFGLGWFLAVMGCYHVIITPVVSITMGLVQSDSIGASLVDAWLAQPLEIEALLVSVVSAIGMLSATSFAALSASRQMLCSVIDSSPVAIITLDASGHINTWNTAAEHIFGWAASEVVGKPLPIVPPERQQESRGLRERASKGETLTQFETVRQRQDGRLIDVSISTSRLLQEDGRVAGLMAAIEDIGERKAAERAARESQALLDLASEAGKMGVWSWDITTDEISFGANHHTLFGVDRSTLGNTLQEVIQRVERGDHPAAALAFRRTRDRGEPFDLTYRVQWPDGSRHWLRSRGRLIQEEGRGDRIVGTTHDVTEQVRTRLEIEHQLLALQEAEGLATLGSFERNWQTGKGYWSEGFCRLLGLPTGTHYDHERFMAFIHPDDRERIATHIRDALTNHCDMNADFRILRADGTVLDIHGIASNSYDEADRPLLTRGTFQDVTETRRLAAQSARLQAQFEQAQRVESVGRLAGGVAHDLNNLLTPILGYADILAQDLDDENAPLAGEIVGAATRARDLVHQLLAFSRRQILSFEVVDLNEVLTQFCRLLRRTIREDVEIVIALAPVLPPLKGDVGQLEQVIMNLAVNAQDAMPEGGTLTLSTSVETWNEQKAARYEGLSQGEWIVLQIGDTGSGMDDETLAHIYEPFYTTKPVGKGTGLGLSTVFGIVKQHGGAIHVTSTPGVGTTFTIYVPACEPSATKSRAHQRAVGPVGGDETILLVEDDASVRSLTHRILARLGYRTLVAASATEAIEIAAAHDNEIDLLLTDVVMPDMNGRELYDHLSALLPGVGALFMSGYDNDVISERGVLENGFGFIQKPFSNEALAAQVRQVLDG